MYVYLSTNNCVMLKDFPSNFLQNKKLMNSPHLCCSFLKLKTSLNVSTICCTITFKFSISFSFSLYISFIGYTKWSKSSNDDLKSPVGAGHMKAQFIFYWLHPYLMYKGGGDNQNSFQCPLSQMIQELHFHHWWINFLST